MKIVGLIAEYNPFHNGHKYHINKIKELYPDSLIVLIINGYFLMRGEPSIISKYNKTKIALNHNIDLVIELPFFFGSNSADIFASSSIFILDKLKCDYLVFGSESNDLKLLKKIADKQINNIDFNNQVKINLMTGINYPTALNKAIGIELNSPNDLLGVSYIKAIKQFNSSIKPITIQRTNDYHDKSSNDQIISATNIRNKINNSENIDQYVPNDVKDKLASINKELLFNLLKYQIITSQNLNKILSVDEGIEKRISRIIKSVNNYDDLVMKLKTKRYTFNRINRMLMHILIGITKEDKQLFSSPTYIKVLGFNDKGQKYLNKIKKSSDIIINTKIEDNLIKSYELKCAYIYQLLTNEDSISFESSNKPIKKED